MIRVLRKQTSPSKVCISAQKGGIVPFERIRAGRPLPSVRTCLAAVIRADGPAPLEGAGLCPEGVTRLKKVPGVETLGFVHIAEKRWKLGKSRSMIAKEHRLEAMLCYITPSCGWPLVRRHPGR